MLKTYFYPVNEYNCVTNSGKVMSLFKKFPELKSLKPSKNYKIRDGMIICIHNNIFYFQIIN